MEVASQLVAFGQDPRARRTTMLFRSAGSDGIEGLHPPDSFLASGEVFQGMALPTIQRGLREKEAVCVGLFVPVRQHDDDYLVCPHAEADGMLVCAAERVEDGVVSLAYFAPVDCRHCDWREVHSEVAWLTAALREAVTGGPLEKAETQF
jgi:hypothetical protein